MPFSWLLWWWFLSLLKRKIKSYRGEGRKHKSSYQGGSGRGCLGTCRQSFHPRPPDLLCPAVGQAEVLSGELWALDTGTLGWNAHSGPF